MRNIDHLLSYGCVYSNLVMGSGMLTCRISILLDIKFVVQETGLITDTYLVSDNETLMLDTIEFSDTFTLIDYIRKIAAENKIVNSKSHKDIKSQLMNYVTTYETGYTFENFKKSIRNKKAINFHILLSSTVNPVSTTLCQLSYHPDLPTIMINYLKDSSDIWNVFASEIVEMNLLDFLKSNKKTPLIINYCRKLQIEKIL